MSPAVSSSFTWCEIVAALTAWLAWSFAHGMWCACAPICFRIWNRRGSASAREMRANWRSVKRAILEWIGQARRPETRAKRIVETAEKASRNERANQWRAQQDKRRS